MNMHDLLRRFSIEAPVIYVRTADGAWIEHKQPPPYTILEIKTTDERIEAVAIDAYKALTVCRETSSLEDARPYAVQIQINR